MDAAHNQLLDQSEAQQANGDEKGAKESKALADKRKEEADKEEEKYREAQDKAKKAEAQRDQALA